MSPEMMHSAKTMFTLVVALILASSHQTGCHAFWLTDSTLFARNAPPSSPVDQREQVSSDKLDSTATWIQLDNTTGALPNLVGVSQQQQLEQQCPCNLDWLRNQTGLLLSKWLQTPTVAHQVRALILSDSTGAQSAHFGHEAHLSARRGAAPARAGGHNSSRAWSVGRSARSGNGNGGSSNNANNQPAPKIIQGERGPQGIQGERGERGERGSSGLISVKDRVSLFELPASDQQSAQLVYLESEQMLVFGSAKLGWRPVELLRPLRDFRKGLAKFTLSSDERRKLLATNGDRRQNIDNSIKLLGSGASSVRHGVGGQDGARLETTDSDNDDDDDDDDDLTDSELDGESESAKELPGNDDDDEEDNDETGDDDDDDEELAQGEPGQPPRDALGAGITRVTSANQRILDGQLSRVPIGQSPVSGRSAAAALVDASIESSLTSQTPIILARVGTKKAADDESSRLQLRLVALNEPFGGNVHGIRGADYECRREAARAQVRGSFRAFLASNFQNLNEVLRYQGRKYPIVNLRGELLADSWHDLFKHPVKVQNPLSKVYSFDGRHVATHPNWPNKLVWHGTGSKLVQRDSQALNCDGWHSDSMSKFAFASPLHVAANQNQNQSQAKRQHQGAPIRRQHSRADWRGKHQKRFTEALNFTAAGQPSGQATSDLVKGSMLLDVIDKYPCRMPLIVLCIETIGTSQVTTSTVGNDIDPNVNNIV